MSSVEVLKFGNKVKKVLFVTNLGLIPIEKRQMIVELMVANRPGADHMGSPLGLAAEENGSGYLTLTCRKKECSLLCVVVMAPPS